MELKNNHNTKASIHNFVYEQISCLILKYADKKLFNFLSLFALR